MIFKKLSASLYAWILLAIALGWIVGSAWYYHVYIQRQIPSSPVPSGGITPEHHDRTPRYDGDEPT